MAYDILFSFVGNRDPYVENSDNEYGPVLAHLQAASYSRVYLICTGPAYVERARTVESIAKHETDTGTFNFINLDLESPIDYEEIYVKLKAALETVADQLPKENARKTILLDPGTPQMQTTWFLLAKSGAFPARLVQGVPPRYAGGTYKVREVGLESDVLPNIVLHPQKPPVEEEPENRWITGTEMKIIGSSESFVSTLELAERYAGYDINILLFGETGSGKGIVAKYIHQMSSRREKPMVEVNCSAISPTLVESELFGHKKGAFTGADSDRMGVFRAAHRGSIFFDEIGDLPPEVQPKLLKAIEEKTLSPVGMDETITVDVRVIAATNKDLEELIREGKFRRDLYERLNETNLRVPPLRERENDILELSEVFLEDWNRKYKENKKISGETWNYLLKYPWEGNVRELQNALKNMCAQSRGDTLTKDLLPPRVLAHFNEESPLAPINYGIPDDGIELNAVLFEIEKQYYEEALKKSAGNREQAARLLGLNGPAFRKACRERFGLGESENFSEHN